jgi:hypothetical protein
MEAYRARIGDAADIGASLFAGKEYLPLGEGSAVDGE